ncbi:thioesterase domain-containing protein [Erwiniaceae bacterium L1_54_6]|nr:thioesterase domain-containing protein [Erwiniaceae bacterium L1_54_6]
MTTEQQNDFFSPGSQTFIAPVTNTQKLVARIWGELFQVERIGLHDNFFDLGGHSLLAVQTLHQVEQRIGVRVPIRDLFASHTVVKLAARIDELRQSDRDQTENHHPNLLQLHQGSDPVHLVVIHPGGGGGTVAAYRSLLDLLAGDPTLFGFNAIDFDEYSSPASSVPEIAAHYLTQLQAVAPGNPCALVGWSAGGQIAYEMACQMAAAGQPPAMLSLIDSKPLLRDGFTEHDWRREFGLFLQFIGWIGATLPAEAAGEWEPVSHWLDRVHHSAKEHVSRENLAYVHGVFRSLQHACAAWQAPTYAGPVELFVPALSGSSTIDFWSQFIGSSTLTTTGGDHYSMMSMPHVRAIAAVINDRLQRIIVEQKGLA